MSNMTNRAPAPNKRSSKRAQTSRDHGKGRSVISSKARLPAMSSGPTASNCIDCQKNEIITRGGLTAFPAQRVLKTLLAPPRHRNEGQRWKEIAQQNHGGPKRADCGKGQTTVTRQPGHWVIL